MNNRYILIFLVLNGLQVQSSDHATLSFQEKRKSISDQLTDAGLAIDCNLNFLARAFRGKNAQEINQHVELVKTLAEKNNPGLVKMRNFEVAIDEIEGGAELGSLHPLNVFKNMGQKYRHQSAIHEAGHILAAVKNPSVISLFGSIALRKKSSGSHFGILVKDSPDASCKDIEMKIVECIAGPVAEQVFNIQDRSMLSRLCEQLSLNFVSKQNVEISLDELVNRCSAKSDMDQVRTILMSLVEHGVLSEEKVLPVLTALYDYTVKLVQDHKKEINALAAELEKNSYISSDKIYEICKVVRPVIDVEQ